MSEREGAFDSRLALAWGLVAVWGVIVWSLGGDNLSAAQTSRFLRPMLEFFYPDLSVAQMYRILVLIRKAAHVGEYALLAILTLRALLLGKRPSAAICAALAFAFILSFATADETRQSFSRARSGSPWDVALDATGGALAIGLLMLMRRRFSAVPTRAANSDEG